MPSEYTSSFDDYLLFIRNEDRKKLERNERLTRIYLSRHPELIDRGYKQIRKMKGIEINMKGGE